MIRAEVKITAAATFGAPAPRGVRLRQDPAFIAFPGTNLSHAVPRSTRMHPSLLVCRSYRAPRTSTRPSAEQKGLPWTRRLG